MAWPRAARGRRGGGGAGAPGGAPLLRALSGSAPPSRAGTARSDVSAAPPAPPGFTRTSAERRGGGRRRGAPCPETRPCQPAPQLASEQPSPQTAPHRRAHPEPPTTWEVVTNPGQEISLAAPSCRIQDARGRMESPGLEGHLRSGLKVGVFDLFAHTQVMAEGTQEGLAGPGFPVWARKGPFSSQDRVSLTAWVVC